jgi:hypothetical protein
MQFLTLSLTQREHAAPRYVYSSPRPGAVRVRKLPSSLPRYRVSVLDLELVSLLGEGATLRRWEMADDRIARVSSDGSASMWPKTCLNPSVADAQRSTRSPALPDRRQLLTRRPAFRLACSQMVKVFP